jgi:hypothetical protein
MYLFSELVRYNWLYFLPAQDLVDSLLHSGVVANVHCVDLQDAKTTPTTGHVTTGLARIGSHTYIRFPHKLLQVWNLRCQFPPGRLAIEELLGREEREM